MAVSAGCSSATDAASTGDSAPEDEAVEVAVTPEDGASEVRPDLPITVEASSGVITEVEVAAEKAPADTANPADAQEDEAGEGEEDSAPLDEITGTLDEDGTQWTSDWTLPPGADFEVTVTAEGDDGEAVETVTEFSTLAAQPGERLELQSNFPTSDQEVGVGMPVILNFDLPVQNKAHVEAAVEVLSEEPNAVAANWVTDQQMVIRAEEYWEPGQEITVNARLAGVQFADGMYADENYQINFEVGREQITTVDDTEHTMVVERDGEQIETFPVSNGDGTTEAYTTTSGTHLIMEKYEHLVMDSETVGIGPEHPDYYKLDVDYAVRFTNSGMFTHSAPWNGQLGQSNQSHGCTNMAPADAKWFHDEALMGDIYIVEGTDRPLEWNNGWGFWERSWEEWLENSELGEAQDTSEPGTPDIEPVGGADAEEEVGEDEAPEEEEGT